MTPRAREEELVVREVEDETLVYDLKRHKAHSLNPTAARVWRYCDGNTTIAEMARRLRAELDTPVDEQVVRLALQRLDGAHLLQERLIPAGGAEQISRRSVARRLGMAAGLTILLPVVTSIVAPTPALAATCLADVPGGACCPPGSILNQPCGGAACPHHVCTPNPTCAGPGESGFKCISNL